MKVRVKFTRTGPMRFLGHLDVMRYFQKAIRRSGLHPAYSEGYSPHMKMSFAEPLGIGQETTGDYFDLELDYPEDPYKGPSGQTMQKMLQDVMAQDFSILSVKRISSLRKDNAMALVRAATYEIRANHRCCTNADCDRFLSQDRILCTRTKKDKSKETDIRPLIYTLTCEHDPTLSETDGEGTTLHLFGAAGSKGHLSPVDFANAFYSFLQMPVKPHEVHICRTDLYTETEDGYQSLEAQGEEICAIIQ